MNHPRCTCGGKKIGSGLPHFLAGNFLATIASDVFSYAASSVRVNTFLQHMPIFVFQLAFRRRSLPVG